MKIARVVVNAHPRVIVDRDGDVTLAPTELANDPLSAIDAVRRGDAFAWERIDPVPLTLLPPVAATGKIVAVGLNYADHTIETGIAQPERPLTFAKYPSSIAGPHDDVIVPDHLSEQVDYEVELAVIIGRRCGGDADVTLADVAAYTVANDISARDVQFGDEQWTRAKSFDTFTPLGPWLVTPDEFGPPAGHRIWLQVGDEMLQEDDTASMIFDVPALLRFIGDGTTLEPGDIILTGTPAGAGGFRTPPRFLQHGDVVAAGIDGIGELHNRITYRSRR